jgi:DNA-binding response OmpR family regulator
LPQPLYGEDRYTVEIDLWIEWRGDPVSAEAPERRRVHKILVIYGEADSSWVVDQVLVPAGYDVSAIPYVSSPTAKVFSSTKPDLVILDIGLAGEPVQDLCRQIRKEWKNVLLFVLGFGEPADRIRMLDLGADDYITKSIDQTEFLARVRTRISAVLFA